MNIIIPYQSKEGHQFLIRLDSLEQNLLPNDLSTEVVGVILEVVSEIPQKSSCETLASLGRIILDFLNSNPNVMLYYICDKDDGIRAKMHERRSAITPQAYRDMIFSKIFSYSTRLHNDQNYIDRPINIVSEGDMYYLHLIGRYHHLKDMEMVEESLKSLASQMK